MNRRRFGLLLLLAVLGGGVFWWKAVYREPSYQGKPLSFWIEEIKTKAFTQVTNGGRIIFPALEAAAAIRAIGAPALPGLLAAVQREETWWQRASGVVGSRMSPQYRGLIPLPAPFDSWGEAFFRIEVANFGRQATPASIPLLLAAMESSRPEVRSTAVGSLGQITNGPLEVLSAVIRGASDVDPETRFRAFASLRRFGAAASNAVPAALAALGRERGGADEYEQVLAAALLGSLGGAATVAIPALQAAAGRSKYSRVRVEAAIALWRIRRQAPDALPALMDAFKDSDAGKKQEIMACLAEMGGEASPAAPILVALVRSSAIADIDNRQIAFRTLQVIAPAVAMTLGQPASTKALSLDLPSIFESHSRGTATGFGIELPSATTPATSLGFDLPPR